MSKLSIGMVVLEELIYLNFFNKKIQENLNLKVEITRDIFYQDYSYSLNIYTCL